MLLSEADLNKMMPRVSPAQQAQPRVNESPAWSSTSMWPFPILIFTLLFTGGFFWIAWKQCGFKTEIRIV